MKIVIVGYGPGGVSAAVTAKTFAQDTDITILTEETYPAHRKPGATLGFESADIEQLSIPDWSPESLAKRGIEVKTGVTVTGGNLKSKILTTRTVKGESETITFDKLILATGGIPALPSIPGVKLTGVFTVRDWTDAHRVGAILDEISSVVIVGAGFSALEAAERLLSLGMETHLIVRSRLLRRLLESELSDELLGRLPSNLSVHSGAAPERITGTDQVSGVIVDGHQIPTDVVLLLTGVKPNISLARELGLQIGTLGGICVNERMETSVQDVYAVGDCVEIQDFLTGKPVLLPTASAAAREGRQAGVAAVGNETLYPEVTVRFQYDRLFKTEIACVGLSTTLASELGVFSEKHLLEDSSEFSHIALVTTKKGRIIGGQVLSSRMAARIGLQLHCRVLNGDSISESPLLKSRYDEFKILLERMLGPLRP